MRKSRARLAVITLVVAAAVAVAGVLSSRLESSPSPRPSIVLISIDTLRADHLGCYGHSRPTSPHIDAIAAEGVRFADAEAQANSTLTSHMSLFTSLLPAQLELTRPDGRNHRQLTTRLTLGPNVRTLAQLLSDAGYETVAFTDGAYVSSRFGFDRGFDRYEENRFGGDSSGYGLRVTLPRLRAFLDERAGAGGGADADAPLFLFVHTYDVHGPYDAPPPFDRQFTETTYAELVQRLGFDPKPSRLNRLPGRPPAGFAEELARFYDNGVRAVDEGLGELRKLLEGAGLYDDAVVVVLSDHGEEFMEHGDFGHGPKLYREVTHVPLIFRLPGGAGAGEVIDAPVALTDVAPTLLELAGLPVPADFEGRSLAPFVRGGAGSPEGRENLMEVSARDVDHAALRDGALKLYDRGDGAPAELYDLGADPGERRNLATSRGDRAAAMRGRLRSWREELRREGAARGWHGVLKAGGKVHGPAAVGEREKEKLRALGYVE